MAGGTHSGVMSDQWWPQSVEYSSRTPCEKDVDLLQPMLSSNCRKEEPDTSKSQLSAYLGFSAVGVNSSSVFTVTVMENEKFEGSIDVKLSLRF